MVKKINKTVPSSNEVVSMAPFLCSFLFKRNVMDMHPMMRRFMEG